MSDNDPKLSNTSRVGFEPKIDQPVKDVELDIGDILKTPEEIDKVSDEDADVINEYFSGNDDHPGFEEVQNELDEFDDILDKKLKGMQIKYDPDEFPQLHAAQQHGPCGRTGSTNIITYDDLRNRWALERAQVRRATGVPRTLDDMDITGSQQQANQEKLTSDNLAKMLAQVLKQILIWVLEFFLKTLAPLKGVPGAKKIPNTIQKAINRLRGGQSVDRGPDSVLDSFDDLGNARDDFKNTRVESEDLARAGGGFISSGREVVDAAIEFLPPECLGHTHNWLQAVDKLITDNPEFVGAYLGKKLNNEVQKRMTALNKIAGLGIPEGHVITRRNGTTLKYSNPLPEEYLRARADGSTKVSAFKKGLIDSVKAVGRTFIPRMRRLIANLASDPRLLCCLIRNLQFIGTTQKLRKILLFIQALLRIWRNLLLIDINKEIARLGNLIIDLLNQTLQTIFSAFTTFFYIELSSNMLGIADLDKLRQVSTECKPWLDIINLAVDILTEMIRRVLEYLAAFFVNFSLDIDRLSKTTDKTALVEFINKMLNLIDKILAFAAAWAFCVENNQDPIVLLGGGARVNVDNTGITLAPKPATNESSGGMSSFGIGSSDDIIFSQTDGASTQGLGKGLPAEGPFSTSGLQILLTNYLGVNSKQANEVIKNITDGDCSCDKSLTPDELATLENLIKERK